MMSTFLQSFYTTGKTEETVDSLLARLEENVSKTPTKDALSFLGSGKDGGVIEAKFSYQDLWDETENLAVHLMETGVKRGDMCVQLFFFIQFFFEKL